MTPRFYIEESSSQILKVTLRGELAPFFYTVALCGGEGVPTTLGGLFF